MNDVLAGSRRMLRGGLTVWIVAAVAVALALGRLPLFNVLGYELALAASAFASLCGLYLGAALARQLARIPAMDRVRPTDPGFALGQSALGAAVLSVGVALIPGLIAAVRGIWTPTCDWWFGIRAYLLMPVVSAALAGVLGHAIAVLAGTRAPAQDRWWKPHRSTVYAYLPVLVLALAGLWRFYSAPPVFIYNALIGYFPGNLYDENVQLGEPLLWSRLEQLLVVLAALGALATWLDVPNFRVARRPRPMERRILAPVFAVLCLGGAGYLHHEGGRLGYAVDASDIEEVLDGRVETAHFVIHYARTPDIEKDIELIARDHELRYAQVVAQTGVAPAGKLRSFYFANRDQKARWMGARDVEMAKPWRREIYLDHRTFPHPSLRHEIAHAVASEFGDPIFGVAATRLVFGLPNPLQIRAGLVEGLAVALDWPSGYERLTPHEAMRAMQVMGNSPTIRQLFSLAFLTVSSARSYTAGGSFVRFLIERYGMEKMRALYSNGGDFDAAYAMSLDVLEGQWREMIGAIVLPADVIEGTRERFRGGSVFSRPCPHANAARREDAGEALGRGDRARAIQLLRDVCRDAPEEPRYKLDLGDILVGGRPSEEAEAEAIWKVLAADTEHVTTSIRAEALERLAKMTAARGDFAATSALIDQADALPVEANMKRQLDAEKFALAYEGAAGPALRGYFFAPATLVDARLWALLATQADPQLGLAHYLKGLQHLNAGEWDAAATELLSGLDLGLPDIGFVKNAARRLALAAYRSGNAVQLSRAIAALYGPGMATTDRLLADDWAQRAVFDATGHL
jgi:hypothetical protein